MILFNLSSYLEVKLFIGHLKTLQIVLIHYVHLSPGLVLVTNLPFTCPISTIKFLCRSGLLRRILLIKTIETNFLQLQPQRYMIVATE